MCNDISRRELLDDCDEAYEFSKSKIYQSIKHRTKHKGYYFEFL